MLRKQLLDTSRGRIVTLLQQGARTVDELAGQLGLTANAVRTQVIGMERDGVVQRVGRRAGTTRPSYMYELTPEVEQLLSRAYIPLLSQLVRVFAKGLPAAQLEELLREAGAGLAEEWLSGKRPSGDLLSRVASASVWLNEQLGALTRVETNGQLIIRGSGCPLAALTGKHPAVCLAMERAVAEIVGVPVHECCDRSGRPQCCFEIGGSGSEPSPSARFPHDA
jgi:predicted ArsR family transcriptional regulator